MYSLEFLPRNSETKLLEILELSCVFISFLLLLPWIYQVVHMYFQNFARSYHNVFVYLCMMVYTGMFATASIDKTVKVWDVANVHNCQQSNSNDSKTKKKVSINVCLSF